MQETVDTPKRPRELGPGCARNPRDSVSSDSVSFIRGPALPSAGSLMGRLPADGKAEPRMENSKDRRFLPTILSGAQLQIDIGDGTFGTDKSSHENKTFIVCRAEGRLGHQRLV